MKTNLMLNAMSDKGISGITKHTTSEQLDAFFLNNKEAMVKAHMDTSHEESRSVATNYVSDVHKSTFSVGDIVIAGSFRHDDYSECGRIDKSEERIVGYVESIERRGISVRGRFSAVGMGFYFSRSFTFPALYVAKATPEVMKQLGIVLERGGSTYYDEERNRKANFSFPISQGYSLGFSPDNENLPTFFNVGCQRVSLLMIMKMAAISKEIMAERDIPELTYEELCYAETKGYLNDKLLKNDVSQFDELREYTQRIKDEYAENRLQFIADMSGASGMIEKMADASLVTNEPPVEEPPVEEQPVPSL